MAGNLSKYEYEAIDNNIKDIGESNGCKVYRLLNTSDNILDFMFLHDGNVDSLRIAIDLDEVYDESSIYETVDQYLKNNLLGYYIGDINSVSLYHKPSITDVIFNDPATIVFWSDDTKTVVKTQDYERYDPEKGLAMAIAKKFIGNKDGGYYEEFKKWMPKSNYKQTVSDILYHLRNSFLSFKNKIGDCELCYNCKFIDLKAEVEPCLHCTHNLGNGSSIYANNWTPKEVE